MDQLSITGGKLTTYREMAADTVDHLLEHVLDLRRRGAVLHDNQHDTILPRIAAQRITPDFARQPFRCHSKMT